MYDGGIPFHVAGDYIPSMEVKKPCIHCIHTAQTSCIG